MDLAPPLSKYGDPRILAHSSDYSHPRTSQAARSLRDDGGPIGPNAPSEVPMQDAPSGHLADADPTLVVAPIPLSPRTPRTCYVPGFAHGRMELVGPPGHAEMVGIGAHLASDDASLALSTTTGGSGLAPGLFRGYPIMIGHIFYGAANTISFAIFRGAWFLASFLGMLTTRNRTTWPKLDPLAHLPPCKSPGCALRPVAAHDPFAWRVDMETKRLPEHATKQQATRNLGKPPCLGRLTRRRGGPVPVFPHGRCSGGEWPDGASKTLDPAVSLRKGIV
ncbi:hypothetical protein C8R44DRAFT_869438 [Mycena epipterygia]|nr:hypothetical protein C8R44DRAFT_869438 [Mycena epipterygia]